MEIIYRANDGKEFKTEAECLQHEAEVMEGVVMWDRAGNRASRTDHAFVLYLRDTDATRAFLALAKAQGDQDVRSIDALDHGLFYWDECLSEYHWLDSDEIRGLRQAFAYLAEREGE